MERLTQDGVDYCLSCGAESCAARGGDIDVRCPDYMRFEKLREYELTGLEPEEVKAKCAWADNTCKLLDGVFGGSGVFDFTHIKELLTAEAEGRLLILPCKVGDTVFAIKDRRIYIVDVIGFRVHEWTGLYVLLLFDSRKTNGSYEFRIEEFGKTVFLSREEAEAALRKESVV